VFVQLDGFKLLEPLYVHKIVLLALLKKEQINVLNVVMESKMKEKNVMMVIK